MGAKTSVAESRMAFASYAKGKENNKIFLPHLLFVRLMFMIFCFGIVVNYNNPKAVIKELYITCTSSQSLILEILE